MLCTIALRRARSQDQPRYDLRISGKTALGPSGTGGQELLSDQTDEEVRATLLQLDLPAEALATANAILADPRLTDHFIPVAEDTQIAFETLDRAGIALFD
ncbi:hypothetical protein [Terriglobus aquaticus]|uniref:Uncharacterized protein n=1 Tax=Terriglobus aquaticus TaxID=940139 RepID=A0ABW9KF22_9BACT|nr:hypothetical protein [Terriglobus aquaticus]